ncbi:MAG: L-fucose:H+ symporter permease [Sphingomonas sp.]|uniref:L-fucose:H+ symporter permease n=1 Tax=Sphingomonas sp. TaxID=28214 RepID=UPI001B245161|nr:L-fucose:H+ symporter permease [Sphingomonas sp.]MBO9623838.1 L-fucose:H+ symporter permease [Sphingomonas sp.]
MNTAPPARVAALPVILITALFFFWGVANNLNDVLIAHFRRAFTLNDLQSGLVQSAFYFGYFCFAIPAALFMKRFGYKGAVLLGLCLFGTGALLFWPAAEAHSYGFFLAALFVIASGLAFLETSANPLVTRLGPPETAERRLNLAQAFNPLGSITGVFIGRELILTQAGSPAAEAASVQLPYLLIALVVLGWAALIAVTRFPAIATERASDEVGSFAQFRMLFGRRAYLLGVVAQFFYVGAQVGVWSYLIRYMGAAVPGTDERTAAGYLILSLAVFMAGRFIGTALMGKVRPALLLGLFAAVNVVLCLIAALVGGWIGTGALVATSFFMSIMFPTIFALSLRDMGDLAKPASSLLVMAIIGGAVLTALMGLVSDKSGSILLAMLVPAGCFVAVLAFARTAAKA